MGRNTELRPLPLGRTEEEEGRSVGGHSPWKVSRWSHGLGIIVLGSSVEEASPLGCLVNQWDKEKGWKSLDSGPGECMQQDREQSVLEADRSPATTLPQV